MLPWFVGFVAVSKYLLIAKAVLEALGQRCSGFFICFKQDGKRGTRCSVKMLNWLGAEVL